MHLVMWLQHSLIVDMQLNIDHNGRIVMFGNTRLKVEIDERLENYRRTHRLTKCITIKYFRVWNSRIDKREQLNITGFCSIDRLTCDHIDRIGTCGRI